MKKSLLLITAAFCLSIGVASTSFSICKDNQEVATEVSASESTYWDSWISSHSSELATGGTTLVTALREKISNVAPGESNTLSYIQLWTAYETTDAIPGSNGAVIYDMYGGFEFNPVNDRAGTYKKEGDVYNREHSVPKSWFGGENAGPAYSDIIHVVPADGYVNNIRNNYNFGEVSSASYTWNFDEGYYNGFKYQEAGCSKLGTPKAIKGISTSESKVFEPDDQYKGDFARIYMYFAVRYGGTVRSAANGHGEATFTDTFTNKNPYMTDYGLALVQKWHEQDPVSDKERTRNDGVESTQGNRNPFVDHPEWADKIFGTHYAPETPSVEISQTSASIQKGDSITLTATASDSSAITWTTSNGAVATVNNGIVNGVSAGSAVITASATIGGDDYSATCNVTVTESSAKVLTGIEIECDVNEVTYASTEESCIEIPAKVIANYSDLSSEDVTDSALYDFDVYPYNVGRQPLTASYKGFEAEHIVMVTNEGSSSYVSDSEIPAYYIDTIDFDFTGLPENSGSFKYGDWNNTGDSGAIYAGKNAISNTKELVFNTDTTYKNSSIIQTTSGGYVKEVDIDWPSSGSSYRKLNVYGKNTPYESTTDLYDEDLRGNLLVEVAKGTTHVEIDGDYKYIGLMSSESTIYINSISLTILGSGEANATPEEQAESWSYFFINETRTNDVCKASSESAKLAGLKSKWQMFEDEYNWMISDSKYEFCHSDNSKIKEARDHYLFIINKFGTSELKNFVTDGTNPLVSAKTMERLDNNTSSSTTIILVVCISSVTLLGLCILVKKRKVN